jgi:hypothetical protein
LWVGLAIAVSAQESGNANDLTKLERELQEAAQIEEPAARLEAYDRILAEHGLRNAERTGEKGEGAGSTETSGAQETIGENESGNGKGSWQVQTETDPMDDSKKVYFLLRSEKGSSSYGSPIVLVIRYSGGNTELYINWRDYLADNSQVTYRIGSGEPNTQQWQQSNDSTATFYPGNVPELLRKLRDVERFVARTIPYDEGPTTAVFDVSGLKQAAAPHMETLGWW